MPNAEYFKYLNPDGTTPQGYGRWPKSRAWLPPIGGELVPCANGYHVLRAQDLLSWSGPELWRVKVDGDVVECNDKVVVRRARLVSRVNTWSDRTMRLFACDCAERALSHVEAPDPRSLAAVAVARRYANGEASDDELMAAGAAERQWQLDRMMQYINGEVS